MNQVFYRERIEEISGNADLSCHIHEVSQQISDLVSFLLRFFGIFVKLSFVLNSEHWR